MNFFDTINASKNLNDFAFSLYNFKKTPTFIYHPDYEEYWDGAGPTEGFTVNRLSLRSHILGDSDNGVDGERYIMMIEVDGEFLGVTHDYSSWGEGKSDIYEVEEIAPGLYKKKGLALKLPYLIPNNG